MTIPPTPPSRFADRLAWLRACRAAPVDAVTRLLGTLAPTDVLAMCNLLRRADVRAWDESCSPWIPRLIGRRVTAATLGALLDHPDAATWPDALPLMLVRGHEDVHAIDGSGHFTRLLQALAVTHPAAVTRLALAKARTDAWSFLWHLPDFQAAGLDAAIRAGLPTLLQHADADVRARALVGLGDGAPPSGRPSAAAPPSPTKGPRTVPQPMAARRPFGP